MTITSRGEHAPRTSVLEVVGSPTINLLVDFDDAAQRLVAVLEGPDGPGQAFDAYLLAAGVHQIVEDHLHRDVGSLGKVARNLPTLLGPQLGEPLAAVVRLLRAVGFRLRCRRSSTRRLIAFGSELSQLVQRLAETVVEGTTMAELGTEPLANVVALPPGLRQTIIRLPHCFRSFDQRPEDIERIVSSFAVRWPDRTSHLEVVGLRTAGSYLAPLAAALLRKDGYEQVDVLTLRPEQGWLGHELVTLASARDRGSRVLVVDEPPRSGAQFVDAAQQLEQVGLPRERIVLCVPLFADALPEALRSYPAVPLPWKDWAIHERLAVETVKADLSELLSGWSVEHVERVDPDPSPRRGHVRALFRVVLVNDASGERVERRLCAEGVGLGYLGRHAIAVGTAVGQFLPQTYGLRDGLLYRDWMADEWQQTASEDPALASRIAGYVAGRNRALAVREDLSRRLSGRSTVLDLVAVMLSGAFGRAQLMVRPLLDAAARRLLETARPSVIDGSMSLEHWFADSGDVDQARKVDFHQRAFSNEDRACYDPVYDLAGAAASTSSRAMGEGLVRAYELLSEDAVAPERWLLYQLLHRWSEARNARREGDGNRLLAAERAMAHTYQRYIAEQFFSDLDVPTSGPLCAIDIDWVLEVRWLDFPAIAPAGARALRILNRNGYRPVIATGRSTSELQERCCAYRLAGGVAEYGAVVHDAIRGRTRTLLADADRDLVDDLRRVLQEMPQIYVAPVYEHTVRAYQIHAAGKAGLGPGQIETALERLGAPDRLRVIPAVSQTDFAVNGIDKGTGLRALAEELDEAHLALAVGDTIEDLPMFQLADRGVAVANADADLCRQIRSGTASIEQARHRCGEGLLEAAQRLTGDSGKHWRTHASPCAPTPASDLLLTVLGALDGGRGAKLRQAALLALRLAAG